MANKNARILAAFDFYKKLIKVFDLHTVYKHNSSTTKTSIFIKTHFSVLCGQEASVPYHEYIDRNTIPVIFTPITTGHDPYKNQ